MITDGRRRAWASISRSALSHNLSLLHSHFGNQGQTFVMAVVKADAYGHDISLVAPACAAAGVTHFGVATVNEGVRLRCLLPPLSLIYILAPVLPADAPDIATNRLIPLISDYELARALAGCASRPGIVYDVHLDVDTGIGRAGVAVSEAHQLLRQLDALPGIRVTGIATHFACADENNIDAHKQMAVFANFIVTLGTRAERLLLHASNSPASLLFSGKHLDDMIRPGLLMYGIDPAPNMLTDANLDLQPVLSLYARVLLCRRLPAGATISYGKTYTVPDGGGVYATIGIGYGDGWPRRLGNGAGDVLLRGRRAPICGRVCMDQFVVDVSHIPDVEAGDIATLIGSDGSETITVGDIAEAIQTTPHEITTCLTARIPRLWSE